jgi:hypothetical protein
MTEPAVSISTRSTGAPAFFAARIARLTVDNLNECLATGMILLFQEDHQQAQLASVVPPAIDRIQAILSNPDVKGAKMSRIGVHRA